jgi:ABC-type amino acid transport substrate-binding protein
MNCEKTSEKQPEISFNYKSYKDIPGVTDEEIRAIEKKKKKTDFFVYGANPTTETFHDENGKISGFTALFCNMLTELVGIPFKPAFYEWDELVAGLESGKVDFSGEFTATEERRKKYFMTDPIALRSIKTFRLAGSHSPKYIAEERLPRYAFLEGTTTIEQVKANLKDFEIFLVNNYEDAHKILEEKKADAFFEEGAAEAAFDTYGDVIAEDVLPLIYGEVSLTTQTESLKPIISVVQKMLKNDGVEYLSKIYNLGQQEYVKHKLFMRFSGEEREYIRENSVIPFIAQRDEYPISFYNSNEKQWQGVAFEVLKNVEVLTGLSFKQEKMLDTGKTYLISGLIPEEDEEERFIYLKTPILKGYYILLSKAGYRNISLNDVLHLKIGLTKGRASASQFQKWFPNHSNAIIYEDLNDALTGLENDEIDLIMTTQRQFLRITNYLELTGYKANFAFDHPFGITFGTSNKDQTLRSIMDKTLDVINIVEISDRWMRKTYDYSLKIAKMKIPWIMGISALIA